MTWPPRLVTDGDDRIRNPHRMLRVWCSITVKASDGEASRREDDADGGEALSSGSSRRRFRRRRAPVGDGHERGVLEEANDVVAEAGIIGIVAWEESHAGAGGR